tara:strand:+ start:25673 stop:26203 length:531 start_codon:yes stop_codon:yes gene_type:complete
VIVRLEVQEPATPDQKGHFVSTTAIPGVVSQGCNIVVQTTSGESVLGRSFRRGERRVTVLMMIVTDLSTIISPKSSVYVSLKKPSAPVAMGSLCVMPVDSSVSQDSPLAKKSVGMESMIIAMVRLMSLLHARANLVRREIVFLAMAVWKKMASGAALGHVSLVHNFVSPTKRGERV